MNTPLPCLLYTSIVFQRRGAGIVLPLVHLAGGDAVADHLGHVFKGHFVAHQAFLLVRRHVDPILVVVFVPSLVVQPGLGESHDLPDVYKRQVSDSSLEQAFRHKHTLKRIRHSINTGLPCLILHMPHSFII